MSYRKIHDTFWTDPDLEEFTPEQKFFYIYLITNPKVNQIGLYEFSIKHAALETGYNIDTVSKLLDFFEKKGKIVRSKKTKELIVRKFWYHNKSESPKVKKHVEDLLSRVKDTLLIQYIYSMDKNLYCIYTQSQEEKEKEKVQEEVEEKPVAKNATEYELFTDKWFKFYLHKNGNKPTFTAVDGQSLKSIISKIKNMIKNAGSNDVPLDLFHMILVNWDSLDKWKQENCMDLKVFNSKFDLIINSLKNETGITETWLNILNKFEQRVNA